MNGSQSAFAPIARVFRTVLLFTLVLWIAQIFLSEPDQRSSRVCYVPFLAYDGVSVRLPLALPRLFPQINADVLIRQSKRTAAFYQDCVVFVGDTLPLTASSWRDQVTVPANPFPFRSE